MDPQYLYTRSYVRHTVSAKTVVKVVIVGTVAAYFARNIVRVIDETVAGISSLQKKETEK
jgi:hypothetical protein